MKTSKAHAEMTALRQLALDDLMSMSDAQLRQEAMEDGEDVDVLATTIKSALRETAAIELRQRLVDARQRVSQSASIGSKRSAYPAIEVLKQLVRGAFEAEPALGLAFRAGKQQTESDWQSLYEDLIELGAIVPDEDAH